jgi:hypothetical protein
MFGFWPIANVKWDLFQHYVNDVKKFVNRLDLGLYFFEGYLDYCLIKPGNFLQQQLELNTH